MSSRPPLWMVVVCNIVRASLTVLALLLAFIVGAAAIVPLAIFALPLVLILGGLLVITVLGATEQMAANWQAARVARRRVMPDMGASEAATKATGATEPSMRPHVVN